MAKQHYAHNESKIRFISNLGPLTWKMGSCTVQIEALPEITRQIVISSEMRTLGILKHYNIPTAVYAALDAGVEKSLLWGINTK